MVWWHCVSAETPGLVDPLPPYSQNPHARPCFLDTIQGSWEFPTPERLALHQDICNLIDKTWKERDRITQPSFSFVKIWLGPHLSVATMSLPSAAGRKALSCDGS